MASFDRSVKILKALGHPIRFQIVQFLLDKPHCVCELKEHLDFSQPNLSQHLKILKEAGIIDSEKAIGINDLLIFISTSLQGQKRSYKIV